jgi:hypothetical protein
MSSNHGLSGASDMSVEIERLNHPCNTYCIIR